MLSFTRYILFPTIFLLIFIRKYRERSWGKCTNTIRLNGKVAIVTGANSGIGYEITKELATRGAQVIMACRNLNKAAMAMYKIKQEIKSTSVIIPMELDLSSIESIKAFANQVALNYNEIHILVNNAGVSYPKHIREKTKDGLEIHFGVNYFGHFILTNLLLNLLSTTRYSRIIMISSMLHEKGEICFEDLNMERTFGYDAYANSKLANIYFCKELARRLQATEVKVVAVCPGWVYTNLFQHHNLKFYQILLTLPVAFLFMRTPKQGAETAIFCATHPYIQSGCIYRECRKYDSKVQFDMEVSGFLWYQSKLMAERMNPSFREGMPFEASVWLQD